MALLVGRYGTTSSPTMPDGNAKNHILLRTWCIGPINSRKVPIFIFMAAPPLSPIHGLVQLPARCLLRHTQGIKVGSPTGSCVQMSLDPNESCIVRYTEQ